MKVKDITTLGSLILILVINATLIMFKLNEFWYIVPPIVMIIGNQWRGWFGVK